MGKDNRAWRKLVKKLRRKRIRAKLAMERDSINEIEIENPLESSIFSRQMEMDELQKLKEVEEELKHESEEQKWIERELQAQLEYQMEKAKQDKLAAIKAEEEKRIRDEWELSQHQEKEVQLEKDRIAKELKEKQDEEFDSFLSFLSGDIETPPLPYVMPEEVDNGKEKCSFFDRTGVCLFAEQCSRNHYRPTLSKTILIPNFFSNFSLEQSLLDEYDTDMCLEYEDTDLYKEFLEFYNDVLPEFRKVGKVIQFKVCCNFGLHLRGNVYVQFETIRESVNAFRQFNARFFNGKQLSLQFAKIESWKAAICGLFLRKRCLKGKACNFLHVFRNPTKEFVSADYDWKDNRVSKTSIIRSSTKHAEPDIANQGRLSSPSHDRSRRRSDKRVNDRKSRNHQSRSRSSRRHRHDSRSRDHDRDRHRSQNEYSYRKKRKSKSPSKPDRIVNEKKKSKKQTKTKDRNSVCDGDSNTAARISTTNSDQDIETVSKADISKGTAAKEKCKKSKKQKETKDRDFICDGESNNAAKISTTHSDQDIEKQSKADISKESPAKEKHKKSKKLKKSKKHKKEKKKSPVESAVSATV